MEKRLLLAENARVRFATGMMMYFAQGVPAGLLVIAMPAWMAAEGAGAGAIASYLAVITLPWSFKLVTGPLMDRYRFPAMGRRRPWVLAAQVGLSLSLLALLLVDNPMDQIGLLMAIGVIINCFAATQDVAVDGMSIDLVPDSEQGRLNAFMSFGKAVGWASSSAASGIVLVTWGLDVAALMAASVSGLIAALFLFVREREGERLLPWSRGKAAAPDDAEGSFRSVFTGLRDVMWSRTSLVMIVILFSDGLVGGYGNALTPVAAIHLFGFTTPEWSQLVAVMGLIGAIFALGLGPVIDRFGAKRTLIATIVLVAAHTFTLAATQHYWENTLYVRVMMSLWVLLGPITMVCIIALAMSICARQISATQFAVYMSIANLGGAVGAKTYGLVAEETSWVQNFTLMGMLMLVTLLAVLLHRQHETRRHPDYVAEGT